MRGIAMAGATLAVLAAAGCGGDDNEDLARDIAAELDAAARGAQASGARIFFHGTVTEDGETFPVRGRATVEAGGRRDKLVSVTYGVEVVQYSDGPISYYDIANLDPTALSKDLDDLPRGIRYLSYNEDEIGDAVGLPGGTVSELNNLDPARQLASFNRLAETRRRVGVEHVRGKRATRYRLTLTVESIFKAAGGDTSQIPDEVAGVEHPTDVWVDEQNRVLKSHFRFKALGQGADATAEVTSFDKDLKVKIPRGPSVYDATDELVAAAKAGE